MVIIIIKKKGMVCMKIDIELFFKDAKYRGECLVFLRKSKGDMQKDLAQMLDMKPGTVWSWEKGVVDFTVGKFGQILCALDINFLEYINTDYVKTDDVINIKLFWKFVENLIVNKEWENNGNAIESAKLEIFKMLVKMVCDYVENL
jgi:transcriptional regulator with XRE-family HTH domain